MTKSYIPSNGSEGSSFISHWCGECKKDQKYYETQDGKDGCQILMLTMIHNPGDPDYPPEWIIDDDYSNPRCTAFDDIKKEDEPKEIQSCAYRDDKTIDMFG